MTCHFCQRTNGGTVPWDQIYHPLGLLGDTRHCCPGCIERVLSAWDRLVQEVRRDALLYDLPAHLRRVERVLRHGHFTPRSVTP